MDHSKQNFVDAHCHLASPKLAEQREAALIRARNQGIRHFLQAGVEPKDWQLQLDLMKKEAGILPCFGLHPYWVSENTESTCDQAMDLLAKQLGQAVALGETGLDFRSQFDADARDRQMQYFEEQVQLAQMANKALVIHVVRAHPEAQKVFSIKGVPPAGFLVHSFHSTRKVAQAYLDMGAYFSIGPSLLDSRSRILREAIDIIPMSRIVIESDSPDQAPAHWPYPLNEPSVIVPIAQVIGTIKDLNFTEVLDKARQNLENLLKIKLG